jgi:hypothetical protein
MSKDHEALKEVAIQILTNMGYLPNEIQQEYWVQPQQTYGMRNSQNHSLHGFRVDVVGLNADKKVAIECGKTPGEKIAALKMFFDEVIILPYFSLNVEQLDLERTIRKKNEIIVQREQTIKDLEKTISDRQEWERIVESITKDWMELLHRIAQHHAYFFYDMSHKSESDIVEALMKEAISLKAIITAREEREKLEHQTAIVVVPNSSK